MEGEIDEMLARSRESRGGGMLIRGERGMGKSALLDHAQERATDHAVVRCAGSPLEASIPWAALHQLLRGASGDGGLWSGPRSAALVSLLEGRDAGKGDRHRVPLALLDLLSEGSEERAVLLLVDDAHLIDQDSAAALAFVAQRLASERVAIILAARMVDDYAFGVPGVPVRDLGPLDRLAVSRLLAELSGERPSMSVVDEIAAATLGNPRAISDLALSLAADQLAGREPLPTPLPLSPSFEAPLLARLRSLPKATQTLLLITALDEEGDGVRLFGAAERLGVAVASALEPAEACGIIHVGASIEFREPLMREAVKRAASFRDRQAVHRAIAGLMEGTGQRELELWHYAQATLGDDEDLAKELEEIGGQVRRSRGCAFATKVLRRSADMSSDPSRRAFRYMLAAESAWMSGQVRHAMELADLAVQSPAASAIVRVRAQVVRASSLLRQGKVTAGIETLVATLHDGDDLDPMHNISALITAACAAFELGDLDRAGRLARRAAALPPGSEEAIPYHFGLTPGSVPHVQHDAAARVALLGEAVATAVDRGDVRWLAFASHAATLYGDGNASLRYAERALQQARDQGAVGLVPDLLILVAATNRTFDRTVSMEADAAEALRLADEMGQEYVSCQALALLAAVTAQQGRTDECLHYAERCVRIASQHGLRFYGAVARRSVALLEIGLGHHEQAFAALLDLQKPGPTSHPVVALWSTPDLVESAVRCRARREALEEPIARYEAWAARGQAPYVLGSLHCMRSLVTEGAEAIESIEESLRYLEGVDGLFTRARAQLIYGETLRRARRRADARVQLRAALETFETLGAAPWASRARAELRASGESSTRNEQTDAQLEMLTPQELQIARLVAAGYTNREVAAQLYLSHRTVEYHLHKMFTKLHVSSRSEMVRLVMEALDLTEVESDRTLSDA